MWLCTSVYVEGQGTLYYDEVTGTWGGSGGACALAITTGARPSPPEGWLDATICPILQLVFQPEGDIVLPVAGTVWDCPPYAV